MDYVNKSSIEDFVFEFSKEILYFAIERLFGILEITISKDKINNIVYNKGKIELFSTENRMPNIYPKKGTYIKGQFRKFNL